MQIFAGRSDMKQLRYGKTTENRYIHFNPLHVGFNFIDLLNRDTNRVQISYTQMRITKSMHLLYGTVTNETNLKCTLLNPLLTYCPTIKNSVRALIVIDKRKRKTVAFKKKV